MQGYTEQVKGEEGKIKGRGNYKGKEYKLREIYKRKNTK